MATSPHLVVGGDPGGLPAIALQLDSTQQNALKVTGVGPGGTINIQPNTYSALSGTVFGGGDNIVLTPTAGLSVRLFYLSLGAPGANASPETVAVRFASATAMYTIPLVPGAVWSRNIGAGKYYLQGAVNDTLILNNPTGQSLCWSAEFLFL